MKILKLVSKEVVPLISVAVPLCFENVKKMKKKLFVFEIPKLSEIMETNGRLRLTISKVGAKL